MHARRFKVLSLSLSLTLALSLSLSRSRALALSLALALALALALGVLVDTRVLLVRVCLVCSLTSGSGGSMPLLRLCCVLH